MASSRRIFSRVFSRIFPIIGVLSLLASFVWAVLQRRFEWPALALGGLGILLFLTIFVESELANLRHYVNGTIYTLFVLGICGIAYILAARHSVQTDFTPQKVHTLSEGTTKNIGFLKKDVEIVVFDSEDKPYRELLDQYAALNPHVTWSLHDPRRDPMFTRKFDENVVEKILYIRSGEKKKRLSLGELSENTITNGIVEVTRETRISVYFLKGHGELPFELKTDPDSSSLSVFKDFLASRAMEVAELDLVQRGYVPQDATLLVLAGPRRDLYPVELRQLETYLAGGGNMLIFLDLPPEKGTSIDFTNVKQLLQPHGLDDEEKCVVDLQGNRLLGDALKIPVLWLSDKHPITQAMLKTTRATIALPLVRALTAIDPMPKNLTVLPVIGSSHEAWTEFFSSLGGPNVKPPQKMDTQPLGWAIEAKRSGGQKSGMRMVVYGSSELVKDKFISNQNTAAILMLNTVNWLTEQEDTVPVPDRIIAGTPLILNDGELTLILILIVMAFPSLIFFGGIIYSRFARSG